MVFCGRSSPRTIASCFSASFWCETRPILYRRQGGERVPGLSVERESTFRMVRRLTALIFLALATPVAALQPLHQDTRVVNGFYVIGFADEIRKKCDSIEPRMFRAIGYIRSLERYARDMGYTSEDIDNLEDNKVEKEKLRKRVRADLAKRGATPETPEGYCTVGREEIAKGSAAGRLLRAK